MFCLFCEIARKNTASEIVYENEHVICFLDIRPINAGHTLVVPKKHYVDLFDAPEEVLCEMIKTVKKVGQALKDAIDCDGVNIGMNNDAAAGQVIFHAHMHVMPRYSDDGYKHWKGKELSNEELVETAKKIREKI